ncbi:MAG: hypothetical protein M1281_00670 [Chloroflexi bacterium]|nr:hypothetical protein [Chloroflexota bacterium]
MDQEVLDLTQKIDALTTQVAYLTEQAQIAERSRQDRAELMDSMMPVAREAMRVASEELEDVQRYLDPEDLIRMLKRIIRHRPQLEMMIDLLDTISDLVPEVTQITKEGVDKATLLMDVLDQKGYFAFGKSGLRMVDNVVTSFTEEDVNRLGDNIVLILNTVKDMTQPEIMTFVRNTLMVASREVEKPVDISYRELIRQMRNPAVRRGLALTMRVLQVVGEQAEPNGKHQ